MLSIDEVIEELKNENDYYTNNGMTDAVEFNTKIIRWLEELKAIKDGSIPIIHGKAELELHDKAIRNEAIDDAKSVILQTLDNEILVDTLHLRLEQLKERNNE